MSFNNVSSIILRKILAVSAPSYFSNLPSDSPQALTVRFLRSNRALSEKMEFIKHSPSLQIVKENLLESIRVGNPTLDFINPDADSLLLYLYLVENKISPETVIHYTNLITAFRHQGLVGYESDLEGKRLVIFEGSKTNVIDLFDQKHVTLLEQLSRDLKIRPDQIKEAFNVVDQECKMIFKIEIPRRYMGIFNSQFKHAFTFVGLPCQDKEAFVSLQLHPKLIQAVIKKAVPKAEPIAMVPVLGTFNWASLAKINREGLYHPVAIWSANVGRNYDMAHGFLNTGIPNTNHDIGHAMIKMLLPKPLLGALKSVSEKTKPINEELVGFEFFEMIACMNFENQLSKSQDRLLHFLKRVVPIFSELSVDRQESFFFLQKTLESLDKHKLLGMDLDSRRTLCLYTLVLKYTPDLHDNVLGTILPLNYYREPQSSCSVS